MLNVKFKIKFKLKMSTCQIKIIWPTETDYVIKS